MTLWTTVHDDTRLAGQIDRQMGLINIDKLVTYLHYAGSEPCAFRRFGGRMSGNIPHVLDSLIREDRLLCPKDATPLRKRDNGLQSPVALWRFKNRSLDLYGQYGGQVREFSDFDFAGKVAASLGFGTDVLQNVIDAVADTTLVATDSAYAAEICDLADRLGIMRAEEHIEHSYVVDNRAAMPSIVSAHVPEKAKAGDNVTRSVRIKNDGTSAFNSHGSTPVYISYHWLNKAGQVVEFEGKRSPIPIDLAPGAAVTVICDVAIPGRSGEYQLQFQAVIEGVRWIEEATLTIPIKVEGSIPRPSGFEYSSREYTYAEEHMNGLYMARDILTQKRGAKRVLEVGGGIHPQGNALTVHDCDVVAIDISSPMSQLGQLYFDHVQKNDRMAFITCDAHEPPFAGETFDAVLIFSALHHFSDPVRLLANLRRVMKHDGFIAVMCEPCSPTRNDPIYLRDLEKGINEQAWTVEEYVEIFRRAGLQVESGRIDGGSLKAILVPE